MVAVAIRRTRLDDVFSELTATMKQRIEFRKVREDGPAVYWYVEAYAESDMFPVGTAYVVEVAGHAQLNFIFVADQWRRCGFGRSIVEAVRERWPAFQITSAMDDPSQAFADAVLVRD